MLRFFKKLNAKAPVKPLQPYLPKKHGIFTSENANPILIKLKEARLAQVREWSCGIAYSQDHDVVSKIEKAIAQHEKKICLKVIERHTLFLKEKELTTNDAAPSSEPEALPAFDIDPALVESFLKKDAPVEDTSAESNTSDHADENNASAAVEADTTAASSTVPHDLDQSMQEAQSRDSAEETKEAPAEAAPTPSDAVTSPALTEATSESPDGDTSKNSDVREDSDAPVSPVPTKPAEADPLPLSPTETNEPSNASPSATPEASPIQSRPVVATSPSQPQPPTEAKRSPVQLKSELAKFQRANTNAKSSSVPLHSISVFTV